MALAMAMALAGAVALAMAMALAGAVAMAMAMALARTVAVAMALAGAVAVAVAGAMVMAMAVVMVMVKNTKGASEMIWMILGFISVVLFMLYQLLALRYDCYHCLLDDDEDKKK